MFKSNTQPLCRFCGKGIRKHTISHRFGQNMEFYHKNWSEGFLANDIARMHAEKPTSRAEAQRYINSGTIVSQRWSKQYKDGELLPRDQQYIDEVTVWDGETWDDEFFCNGDHARQFAYVVAAAGKLAMNAYWEARAAQQAKEKA